MALVPPPPSFAPFHAFVVDGTAYTLDEMLARHADDAEMVAWLTAAHHGDVWRDFIDCILIEPKDLKCTN